MSIKLAPGIALAAVLAISGSSLAVAGGTNTVTIDSEIVMRDSFPAFHGKVKSSNSACLQPRLVKLFKLRRNGGRKLLGKSAHRQRRTLAGDRRPAELGRLPLGGQTAGGGDGRDDLRLRPRQVADHRGRLTEPPAELRP